MVESYWLMNRLDKQKKCEQKINTVFNGNINAHYRDATASNMSRMLS
jgi:hypothetical protein